MLPLRYVQAFQCVCQAQTHIHTPRLAIFRASNVSLVCCLADMDEAAVKVDVVPLERQGFPEAMRLRTDSGTGVGPGVKSRFFWVTSYRYRKARY